MNLFKRILLFSAVAGLSVCQSCKDDKDDSFDDNDPRIRTMYIDGFKCAFVVNDVEGVIFNYDSLTYGTDVTKLDVSFYGYDVDRYVEFKKGDEWIPYKDSAKCMQLDLTNLTIRSFSKNRKNVKEYKIDLRVHQCDVNSFMWNSAASLPSDKKFVASRALVSDSSIFVLAKSADGFFLLKSSDKASSWTSSKLDLASADCSSFTACGSDFVVRNFDGSLSLISKSGSVSGLDCAVSVDHLLFELNQKLWFISSDGDIDWLCNVKDGKVKKLPDTFKSDSIVSAVAKSGKTTSLGYVYNTDGTSAQLWSVDVNGNVLQFASDKNGLPVVFNPAFALIDSELDLIGGQKADGSYSSDYYTSADGGLNWSNNWHKTLPKSIGAKSDISALILGDYIYLVGGVNKDGFDSSVWKGSLVTVEY